VEVVALGPAKVHPEEHLGPVGRLRTSGSGADRQERAPVVVVAVEQERGPLTLEVGSQGIGFTVELDRQLRVARFLDELEGRQEVGDPGFKAAPQLDLRSETVGLAEDLLGYPLVIPEPGLGGLRLELRGARFLRPEVKDAPRSTESARPDREPWRRPLIPDLEILEQDWPELDQAQG
jgi:hypothetical protein